MELRISKYKTKAENTSASKNLPDMAGFSSGTEDSLWRSQPRETVSYENGVSLHRQADHYILSIGEQEMEIDEEDVIEIAADPDIAFEIVVEKKRKFNFNAASDNYEVAKYR